MPQPKNKSRGHGKPNRDTGNKSLAAELQRRDREIAELKRKLREANAPDGDPREARQATMSDLHGMPEIAVPSGRIRVQRSMDPALGGNVLMHVDNEGAERGAVLLAYDDEAGKLTATVWSPEDPDGDPVFDVFWEVDA